VFDEVIPRNGYVWWYVDAVSDDGEHGLTIIAFVGSVFSPYYAFARRRAGDAGADPMNHCSLNIALYGKRNSRWAMTERGCGSVERNETSLSIGPSAMYWQDQKLVIDFDEICVPWPRRIRGQIVLHPEALNQESHVLDRAGLHRWRPISPCARVSVNIRSPQLAWHGPAYFDSNAGDAPLENSFRSWQWSRVKLPSAADHKPDIAGDTAVLYDILRLDGSTLFLTRKYAPHAARQESSQHLDMPANASSIALPPSAWGLPRTTRGTGQGAADTTQIQIATLEDGPFYARSSVSMPHGSQTAQAIHESLSLDRFRSPWVQAMLPFRMPRRIGPPARRT